MADQKIDVISSIYDAALDDERWQGALHGLSHQIGSIGAVLMAVDRVNLPYSIEQSSFPKEHVKYYFDHYGNFDRDVMIGPLQRHEPLKLLRDVDVWPDTDLDQRPDYQFLRAQIGSRNRALVRLSRDGGWSDLLALPFSQNWADHFITTQQRLGGFLPHLAKVVKINRQFALLRRMYGAALAALDQIRIGTCVVNQRGDVILQNREAQRIFSVGDGVVLNRSQRITLTDAEESAKMARYISHVIMTAEGRGDVTEYICVAKRPSCDRSFILEVCPLRDSCAELERHLVGCLVFVIDPESLGTPSADRIAKVYQLTKAESDICSLMLTGKSAGEIADLRSVSEGTVKTQFRSIYHKCGVQRRVDLIRLSLSIEPPLVWKDN